MNEKSLTKLDIWAHSEDWLCRQYNLKEEIENVFHNLQKIQGIKKRKQTALTVESIY